MKKLKDKAETIITKDEAEVKTFVEFLGFMADHLDWENRGILEDDPEAKIVVHQVDLEVRLQELEKKHQDLVDNIRFVMDNGKGGA
jgi:hypothetical protein